MVAYSHWVSCGACFQCGLSAEPSQPPFCAASVGGIMTNCTKIDAGVMESGIFGQRA